MALANVENMSDEEKRRVAGQGNFMCASIFCCIAFICGMNAAWDCSFLKRDVVLSDEFIDSCVVAGVAEDVCNALVQPQGIGFYGFEVTVPVDQDICLGYTQHIDGVGYVTPDFDTRFNAAKGFTVVANVFGGVAFLTLWLASCCVMSQERIKGLSCHFFIATLFQGLTFLIYRSVVCHRGFFKEYFQNMETDDDGIPTDILDVNCSLGQGGKLSIVATVFYFLCLNMIPVAIPPTPIGMGGNASGTTTEPEAATEEAFTEEPKTVEP